MLPYVSYKTKPFVNRFILSAILIEVEGGSFEPCHSGSRPTLPPVFALRIDIVSSKTHGPKMKKTSVAPIVFMEGVGSFHEQQLFGDLIQWRKESGTSRPDDFLCSRWAIVGNRTKPS